MYQTVYEIGAVPPRVGEWVGFLLAGVLIIAIGRQVRKRRFGLPFQRVIPFVVGTGFVIGGATSLVVGWYKHHRAYRAYSRGDVAVYEGQVKLLREQPVGGHAPGDLVDVAGRELEVNYFMANEPGYRLTVAHGGVLQDGARVRVAVYEGRILEVDLRESSAAPATSNLP